MYSDSYQQRCQQLSALSAALFNATGASTVHAQSLFVLECSDFVANILRQTPNVLEALWRSGDLKRAYNSTEMTSSLAAQLRDVNDEDTLMRRLRQFRKREMTRIIWRDLNGDAKLNETLQDLSSLADCCVQQSYQKLSLWLQKIYGTPRDKQGVEQPLIVLAMGKLGARELNLSSDIDLIYCFPKHGKTDGKRELSNEEYFVRLGRKLLNVLSKQTSDGFVFRVDLRLRPFGESGPLVSSYDAMETYYYAQARDWERYAMVKVRPITGSKAQTEPLMAILRAFVYRRYIDFGAIESIREMKALIEHELRSKEIDLNIKLGRGGIREIEFIGQAFQLIRGGRAPNLQIRSILSVLQQIAEMQLLPGYAVNELCAAYRFFRLTENRIQAWQDQQTHNLFTDDDGQHRLARSMGFDTWKTFANALEKHRLRVHSHFEQVFLAPQAEASPAESSLSQYWILDEYENKHIDALTEVGFKHAASLLKALQSVKTSPALRKISTRGEKRLARLIPMLLQASLQTSSPDNTVLRLLKLIESVASRTAYLDLLVENPLALSQLVKLTGESAWIANLLSRHPILLDELLDPRSLYKPLQQHELHSELNQQINWAKQDLEQEMESLRQFAQSNRLKVAAADICGRLPLMIVSDYLTAIAETLLQQAQAIAWRNLCERHGKPSGLAPGTTGFAIIAYGKLGGIELGYGSDLDLVFLHANHPASAMTDGEKAIANDVFYARLGQRIIHILSARMPSGTLYATDMRLRPNGNSGMLVASLAAFESYQLKDAWTWEHQALVRARAVAGDKEVISVFNKIRQQVLCQPRDRQKLRNEVLTMRQKMRDKLDKSGTDLFDIKQGHGGLVDIEFMVQFAVLHWAKQYPQLTQWSDNMRLLDTLCEANLIDPSLGKQLQQVYQALRAIVHRSALQETSPLQAPEAIRQERQIVSNIWRVLMLNQPPTT